jgi:hypothetical protein
MSISEVKSGSGYIGPEPKTRLQTYNMAGDRIEKIYNVVVYEFAMGDVEDPEIYAAEPIWRWQQTEQGQWIMEHAAESPVWHRNIDANTVSFRFIITAKLREKDYTFWCLKWANTLAK